MVKVASDLLVLVVDDEQDIRSFLATVLRDAGFRVATASDGKEALEKVKQERPDFVSLDLVMPGKSGISFLYELRRNREWVNIPVMVVTGHAQDEFGRADLASALQARLLSGPSTYLEKPVTAERYVQAVTRALGVDPPDEAAAGDDQSLRDEASRLLREASPERLAEVLAMLKKR